MFLRITVAAIALATSAVAADFRQYENGRFGYSIDLPADFKTVMVPANGDGLGLESADGAAKLSVWGNYITEGGFGAESTLRRNFSAEDGWNFTYEKTGASWASYSGVKGDRIIYIRQIALCEDAMGNFTIDYPASAQKRYGPLIGRLVKTLRAPVHCK